MDFMPLRLNSVSLTCSICALAAIFLQLVAMECRKLHMVDSPIVELIMLSWQQILLYNFHDMRVTWLFCHFFKLEIHILHGLENSLIFNIQKL